MSASGEFTNEYGLTGPFEDWGDEELARAGKEGFGEARNVLYMRHRALVGKLRGYARNILRIAINSGRVNVIIDEENVEQQAFVVFCELLGTWEPLSGPFIKYMKSKMPWRLREYVHDSIVGRHGDVSRRTLPLETHGDYIEALLLPRASEDIGEDLGAMAEWGDHIRYLPFVLRATVKLRYYDDLTSAQIAGLTGHSRREINRTLHDAIAILRLELQDRWEGT